MALQDESVVPYQQQQETAPLHQKSFKVDFIGKRRPKSKQQVTWSFVHGNETHTVMLTWSTQTGKVLIHVDGDEIDFYDCKGFSILQRKFECFGMKFEVLGTRVVPNHVEASDFLSYECIINGQAFSSLPFLGESRLVTETPNGENGQPLLITNGDDSSYSSSESELQHEEDVATPYYMEMVSSVVDIVYPNGIPSS